MIFFAAPQRVISFTPPHGGLRAHPTLFLDFYNASWWVKNPPYISRRVLQTKREFVPLVVGVIASEAKQSRISMREIVRRGGSAYGLLAMTRIWGFAA